MNCIHFVVKRNNLKLKTRLKQLLGFLLLAFELPGVHPDWFRYKVHFTYLGATRAKCHSPILRYIFVHHCSNPDLISDLTYHPNIHHIRLHNISIWAVSRTPVLGKYQ